MLRRMTIVVAMAIAAALVFVGEADAASRYMSRTTGTAADAYWTQVDGTPVGSGPFGNVHHGWLSVFETSKGKADVFVYIDDFDCEPGQQPWSGHGEGGCEYLGSRFGEAFGLDFTVGRKLSSAHLRGQITMYGGGFHGEGGSVVGTPTVDMQWTALGNSAKTVWTYRYTENGTSYSDRYRATVQQSTLSGQIGSMSFDPAASGGSVSSFSQTSQSRTR